MSNEMGLGSLKPQRGSVRGRRRIGRGQGSGLGGTSTRGHKGAQSRSGYSRKIGFEGGQMPLQRRLPKFGFTNKFRVAYRPINLEVLERLAKAQELTVITPEVLRENKLVKRAERYKILSKGELTVKLEVQAHAVSEAARKAIEAQGGAITIL